MIIRIIAKQHKHKCNIMWPEQVMMEIVAVSVIIVKQLWYDYHLQPSLLIENQEGSHQWYHVTKRHCGCHNCELVTKCSNCNHVIVVTLWQPQLRGLLVNLLVQCHHNFKLLNKELFSEDYLYKPRWQRHLCILRFKKNEEEECSNDLTYRYLSLLIVVLTSLLNLNCNSLP